MRTVKYLLPAILLLASLMLPTFAHAASPHFIRADASLQGTNLVVSFKEAGLGDNQNISYVASANATAEYACQNGGGNFPSDPKKQLVQGPVSASGTFSSGKNGQINASLTLSLPPSTLDCPPGQRVVLLSFSYSNVTITDTTNGVSASISGTFSG